MSKLGIKEHVLESLQMSDSFVRNYNNKYSMNNNTLCTKVADGLYIVTGSVFRKSNQSIADEWYFGTPVLPGPYKDIQQCKLSVFDSWGEPLFESWGCRVNEMILDHIKTTKVKDLDFVVITSCLGDYVTKNDEM